MTAPLNLGTLYRRLIDELAVGNIEEPQLEARMLLAHVAGIDQTRILGYPEDDIGAETVQVLDQLIQRRKSGEPIAYLIGSREFWSLNFKVTRDTLIPRPDSETLVEAVLQNIPDKKTALSILDLGTGTGCLLLSLLSELPNAKGTGIDINEGACNVAAENALELGLTDRANFVKSNWFEGISEKFDLIISNPPYILEADIATLETDVKQFEPHLALSGGKDGLTAYRQIATQAPLHLTVHGLLAVEFGIGQASDIKEIFSKKGLKTQTIHRDIGNIDRCILATVEDS